MNQFCQLLDSKKVNERQILRFINKEHNAYFIIASLLTKYFNFGHHGAYVFPEVPLGNSYKVDYVLVGVNSDGWNFVFVELEDPSQRVTLENGDLGLSFRKGISQVVDWEAWLEAYYTSLTEVFQKYKHVDALLPQEFITLDKSRFHFVVIAGRRKDFYDKTYRIRRKKQKNGEELILHYDNLIDAANYIIGLPTY